MAFSELNREQHQRSLAEEVLRTSGHLRLAARGYSMLPSLWPGDVLSIQSTTPDQAVRGDLVLYAREGSFYIHRVLRRARVDQQMCLITRGDSMPREDHPVSSSELLGKVIAAERNGRMLPQVPACTPVVRALGLALAWGRLRNLVLRLRQRRASGLAITSNGAVSL
jgi:signal peptidase I